MGISDFGQANGLISKRFQEVCYLRKGWKVRIGSCWESLLRWISKAEVRTEGIRAVWEKKPYEMNKCLTLVHLTGNGLRKSCSWYAHDQQTRCTYLQL